MKTFEFDVTLTTRRRMHLRGPADRETARAILKRTIEDGIAPGIFDVRDVHGFATETLIGEALVEDPAAGGVQ
jgi:aryl-alcohol dehydrogenase-like predicted oxidoreductase